MMGAVPFNTAAAPGTNEAPVPFLRLREATLEYGGPSEDLADLTEIRVGWFGPADRDDPLNGDLWWAASLAVEEANTQGGVCGLPVRLVPCWAADPWGTGVSRLARMIYDEQPLAVLGSVDSAATHLAEQVVAKARLPLVSPIATDKSVTLAGVSWMFSCAPTDDVIARVLVADVLGALRETDPKIVLLSATDHESRMTALEVRRELTRRLRPPDFQFELSPGARAVTNQIAAIAQLQPAAVVIVAGTEDAATLVRAVREKCPAAALFGTHSMGRSRFLDLAGQPAVGVRFPLLFAPDPADPVSVRFIERFKAEHHREPDYTAALTYDAARLLLEAIRRGGLNRARIREAIVHLSPWAGMAGTIHWDGTGQNTRSNVGMDVIRSERVGSAKADSLAGQTEN